MPMELRCKSEQARREGFSLVELLVVVAIIVILVTLVAPSLNRAKLLARETQCRSNLSHLQKAYASYGTAWSGRLLPYICDNTRPDAFWMEALRKYHGNMDAIRDCPLVPRRSGGWGSTFVAWGPCGGWMAGHSGAYAINGWMYDMGPWGGAWGDAWDYETITVPRPSNVPVWFDCSWVDAWPQDTNAPPADYEEVWTGYNDGGIGRLCIARHGLAVNVAFADATVRKVALPDLWLLKWHKEFQPQHVAFPDP